MVMKIKKFFRWLLAQCVDEKADIKVRLFRVIILLGILGGLLAILSNLAVGAGSLVPLFGLIGIGLFVIAFYESLRKTDCRNLFAVMIFLVNSVLFPLTFLSSGGIDSGVPLWLMFGLILVFLFLKGWRFYLVLATSVISLIAAYGIAIVRPELMVSLKSRGTSYEASRNSVILTGILIGTIFYLQSRLYEKAREETERQKEIIREISDSRNLFFTNMSHEIRTPINTIIGLNEMTLREDISDEVAQNALNIQNASKILLAVINDILDLSKIESGKMEIVPVRYETASMFSDLVNVIWIRAYEKKLEFSIDIDPDIPCALFGDEVRIKQILVNLLTNAVKYTEKGSVSLTVKGEPAENGRILLKMAVRDTGIGIKQESMDALFSTFRRVDEAKNRKIEGTGLGLAISKQLVEMMGGTITVDSIYTKGSVFTVTLEQEIADSASMGSMKPAIRQSLKDRPKYSRSFEAPEAKVLIVDDNEMNRMVAVKLLRDTKVQTDTAAGGAECLKKTMEQYYHVIFMDHLMPDMDGEETLRALRKRTEGYCQETPVIALTANVMSGAAEIYRGKGFDDYLAKPINGAAFEAILQKYLPPELITWSAKDESDGGQDWISSITASGRKKKRLRITTDCVCDLPQELLDKYDVRTMFYYVSTGEGHFRDMTEILPQNLLEYMKHGQKAESVPASAQEYEQFFADNLVEAEEVIHISMSARISKGYAAALTAARGFGNVRVLDSGHLSGGLGLLVLEAAKMAQEGAAAQDICGRLESLSDRISTTFIVDSPDNLYLSGRMDRNTYRLCHFWHLHSVLELYRGRMFSPRAYLGRMESARNRYIRRRLRSPEKIDDRILLIIYAGCTVAQLEQIQKEVERCMHFQQIYLQQASSAVASNCGAGAFGLIYFKK